MSRTRARILLAGPAPGPDHPVEAGDERAAPSVDAVARALRDAGHEVVYAGPAASPDRLAAAALQEDADLLGLCLAGGPPLPQLPAQVADCLRADGAPEITVFAVGAEAPPGGPPALPASASVADVVAWVAGRLDQQAW